MSERLPYEEQLKQQWDDLPLPDVNMAWEDMKRRLEEEDDDTIIPFWLRGCGLWGLLLVVLLGIGWWLFRQPKSENKDEDTQKAQHIIQKGVDVSKNNKERKDSQKPENDKPAGRSNQSKYATDKKNYYDTISFDKLNQKKNAIKKRNNEIFVGDKKRIINKTKRQEPYLKQSILKKKSKIKEEKKISNKNDVSITPGSALKTEGNAPQQVVRKNNPGVISNDSSEISVDARNIDTIHMVIKDSIKKKINGQTIKDTVPKKDSSKPKSISFSAGIALHQLLPVDGQKLTPYNSQGRKSSLADYIPSVFLRMYKNEKWFLQSEFRYGAPQYTREIIYKQKGVLDTFGTTNTITSAKLKKTFYHQLPVSFNYFVLPGWSVGGGFVWNKFKGAVSEQDVVQRTVSTGIDTVISKGVILNSKKADSNFARSYFQALVETQYRWKRFSLGARYSFGLQPYLKFTLPGSTQQNERNRSLQIFIRYELWKSRVKNLREKRR